ncbi:Gfo/Idh/MocA family oxidoreductase [Actinomycetes bacterium KLBMP 9759]
MAAINTIKDGLRVGLVGAGGIARLHLPAWLALGAQVTVHSIDGGAGALVTQFGGGEVADSLDELLDAVEVVDVVTPTFTHPEIVVAAAAAGRHIVCEKPFALDTTTAEAMVKACASAGVQLVPGHVVRYFAEYSALQRAVAAGAIGAPAVLRFHRCGSRPLGGWFADPALSGGLVMDQMIHDLDFARWIGGEIETVFARIVDSAPGTTDGVVSAHVTATHAGGAISSCTGTWARQGTRFRYGFQVAGTDGVLEHDSAGAAPLVVDSGATRADGGLVPISPTMESPFLTELREFAVSFSGGPPPRVSAEDGVAAVRLAVAANTSIRTGAPVQVAA